MRADLGTHTLGFDRVGTAPPTFVCLHGLADTRAVWKRIVPGLARLGGVVTVDQRGHGETGAAGGPDDRGDLAADAIALLDRLEVERTILVGHSMGGIVAMTTALLRPDRVTGLVLLGTASQCNQRAANWYERIAVAAERNGLDGLSRAIFGADARRKIDGDPATIARVTRCLRSLYDAPLTPRLRELRCPVLLLVGSRDPMGAGASSILLRALPAAVLEVVPDRGHWLHLEAPGLVVRSIERFLRAESVGPDPNIRGE